MQALAGPQIGVVDYNVRVGNGALVVVVVDDGNLVILEVLGYPFQR